MASELPRYNAASTPGAIGFSPRAVDTGQVGRALSGAAGAVRATNTELRAREREVAEREAAAAAQKSLAEFRSAWARRTVDAKEAAPLGAAGFTDAIEEEFQADVQARMAAAPELARPWMQGQFDAERDRLVTDASRFEAASRSEKRKQDTLDAIELNANAVRTDAGLFEKSMGGSLAAIAASGLSAPIAEALADDARQRTAVALLQGLNERNPLAARRALEEGKFDSLMTPEAKNILVNDNAVELRRRKAEQQAAVAGAKAEIRDVVGLLKEGFDPGRERLLALARVAAGDEGLSQDIDNAVLLYEFQRGARTMTPADLQGWINDERASLAGKSGVSTFEADRIRLAEGLLSNMAEGIRRDPLSTAARFGVRAVAPLTLAGGVEVPHGPPSERKTAAEASIGQRKADARAVAGYYGIEPKFLTDEEASQLASMAEGEDLDTRLSLVATVAQGFGGDAPAVFREISEKGAPGFAHAGGLAMTGDGQAARDMLAGTKLLADKSVDLPPPADRQLAREAVVGSAFTLSPATGGAHRDAAEAIYATRAARRGLPAGILDADLWETSQQLAAGAVYSNGTRFGGIVDFNGRQIVVPADIAAGQFGDVVNALTDEDLAGAAHGDGTPLAAEDLADGLFNNPDVWLVSAGHGRYRIAVTDPVDGDPEWIGHAGGTEPYILDLGPDGLLPAIRARAAEGDGQ